MRWSIANSYFGLSPRRGRGRQANHRFAPFSQKVTVGSVVIRHSVTDLRDLLHEVRREKRVSLRSPRYAPELLICRIFSRDLSSSLSTRDLRFLRAGYAEYHPPSLILLRSLLRGGNGSEGTSQGNRVLRVRELSLIRPRGHAAECTVKFVIGASIVALSTVRRKCRFSVSPPPTFFLLRSRSSPIHRAVSPRVLYSLARLLRGSFRPDDVNPYRPTFNLSWKYICGKP